LESLKIIRREAYQANPLRYQYLLTASGAQLLPVIQAMGRWTAGHVEGIWSVPDDFYRWTPEMYFNNELGLNRNK
jgi:DNA-binding HxlR family transcriptional regulator